MNEAKAKRRRERQQRARRVGRYVSPGLLLLGVVSWVLPDAVIIPLWRAAFAVAAVIFFRSFA